ncbi:MAG: hypothetical protein IT577_00270 [Verrucomicrobiae bacterium]|nr:hypothetical protein [Verrucomicrobiae bacterium]
MRAIQVVSVAAAVLCGAGTSLAQRIQVLEAYYGADGRYVNVTQRVQRIADSGRREFEVCNESLGVDPAKGREKKLRVEYISGGKRYSDEVKEDKNFRFEQGGRWGCWDPWFQGVWPGASYGRIEFRNECGDRLSIYHVNDYGRWVFVRELFDGEGFSVRSPRGQTWLVTDARNRIIRQLQCGRDSETIVIRRGDGDGWWGNGGGVTRIQFSNRTGDRVNVHRVDRNGRWDRVAEIKKGDSEGVRFSPGEPWVVTDDRNRLILSGRAGRGDERIEVRR